MKKLSVSLLLSFLLLLCSNLFAQKIKVDWRGMTDQELQRLKQKEGHHRIQVIHERSK